MIRDTPIIGLEDDRVDLYAKLEFLNGVGSIKDRPAFWILKCAIERGEVVPSTTVIESSSGNFACALATFCRMLELKFVPVIDPNIPPLYESYLRAHCDQVVKVTDCDDAGGYLKTRLGVVRDRLARNPEIYWPNQYQNLDGMAAHYHLTAGEIRRLLPRPDYVFMGVSSAGTIAGVSRRLKEHDPRIQIIAVDTEGSVIFGQCPKRRYISGIGSSIFPSLLTQALIDDIMIVPELEAVHACRLLWQRHGLFVGGSTGAVYSAIQRYFRTDKPGQRAKVLFLCCDRGTAYLHNVFNSKWAPWNSGTSEPRIVRVGA
jgi:N-(2-amino-2-carboxyethyl)-L-glutamate synthase